MAMLRLSNIVKRYGDVVALDGVSLNIERGEIFGIIGADGAGKTSLFRIIATLLLSDGGECAVDGLDVRRQYKQIRRIIGYMPGQFSLYQDLTVEENLELFATIFGTTISENYHLIRDVYSQIEPFKKRKAAKLSGGMKQKLALSCALIHAPKVLLLDEPTTGVDPVSRTDFWAMLRRLKEEFGITIVVSTPYRDEVMRCDRIALMSQGKVLAVGAPQEVMPSEKGITANRGDMTADDCAIEACQLTKQFGDFTAVNQVSFKVQRGEIFGFLGANGAGKTTAMRMLCGLSQPSGGWARVAGFDVARQSEDVKRHIGYMSQRFSLYDDLSVADNLTLFGGIYGMSRSQIKEKSREVIERLQLTQHAHKQVHLLPLGWKQKLAFAVATFHSPQIVFLDEPTGGVDADTRVEFWQQIYEAAARGMTIFVTTHYMDEAEYCDRISIMVDGEIRALDSPAALKRRFGAETIYEVFVKLARTAQRT
ncbi:MAG: ATP-binding cassette domain-containing protein [Muribaculaceae bacterium]